MINSQSSNSDSEITLGLLRAVDGDATLTQRSAARELGVALGLVNAYLQRCVKKGLVKVRQVPRNRYIYYLTPKGFAEKSRLTAEFLSQSLNLFRQAQWDYMALLTQCTENEWKTIALYGASDLVAIVALHARDYPVRVIGIVESSSGSDPQDVVPAIDLATAKAEADAFFITDLSDPQNAYETLGASVDPSRILAPDLLEITTVEKRKPR